MTRYTINGAEFPRVMTILGLKDKSAVLTGWAVRCMAEYIKVKSMFVDGNYIVSKELLQKAQYNYDMIKQVIISTGILSVLVII